jgi:hypothetical protein
MSGDANGEKNRLGRVVGAAANQPWTRCVNELMELYAGMLQEQAPVWTRMLGKMRDGSYTVDAYLEDATRMWGQWGTYWQRLAAFPFAQLFADERTPMLTFVLDEAAEACDAQQIVLTRPVGAEYEVFRTDLRRLDGDGQISRDQVDAELKRDQDRLAVGLNSFTKRPAAGHYLGLVGARPEGSQYPAWPLATVYVIVS